MIKTTDYKFKTEEIAILKLVDKFSKLRMKHFQFHHAVLPKKKDPRNGKNWKFFVKFKKVLDAYPLVDADKWILAQLLFAKNMGMKHCPPSWLCSSGSMKRYAWYVEQAEKIQEDKKGQVSDVSIKLYSLQQSILFLQRKMKEYNCHDYVKLFCIKEAGFVPLIYSWAISGSVSKLFLSVSKSYHEIFRTLDPDIQTSIPAPDSLIGLRRKIILTPVLRDFCHKYLNKESMV
jgi:hypothetical protein